MKNRTAQVIFLADYEHLRRRATRPGSSPMGVVLSFDKCRTRRVEAARHEAAKPARKSAFETRAPRNG